MKSKTTPPRPADDSVKPTRAYDEQLKQEICARIAGGETLTSILKCKGMPSHMTIWRWRQKDRDFDAAYLEAMQMLTTKLADEILELADKSTPENAHANRVKMDARRWYCSKFHPRMFGDKPELQVTVNANTKTLVISDPERARLIEMRNRALSSNVDAHVLPRGERAPGTLALPERAEPAPPSDPWPGTKRSQDFDRMDDKHNRRQEQIERENAQKVIDEAPSDYDYDL